MPLSFFNHQTKSHYREGIGSTSKYGHKFGGDASTDGIRFVNCEPIHLIYRLNQADPALDLGIPGVNWLPLFYHFSFAAYDGRLIYRMLSELEIELLAPMEASYDADFPISDFPVTFPMTNASFEKQRYDPTNAEDALKLAAVFGLEQLSKPEMERAIVIAEETARTVSEFGLPDWTPEDIVRESHREPFSQGAPSKQCGNPDCPAEVLYRTEELTVTIENKEFRELTGQNSLTLEPRDVRRNSMRVFAIHDPEGDNRVWPHVQLIFEVCECCHCIRVTNQCT